MNDRVEKICLICFDDMNCLSNMIDVNGQIINIGQLPCGHEFCDVCIKKWLHNSSHCPRCPCCRHYCSEMDVKVFVRDLNTKKLIILRQICELTCRSGIQSSRELSIDVDLEDIEYEYKCMMYKYDREKNNEAEMKFMIICRELLNTNKTL